MPHRRFSYRLFSADGVTPFGDVTLSFSAPAPTHGRITITVTYPDPSGVGPLRCHAQSQSWFQNNLGDMLMCVGRFSLPDALKRRGIGTWIWSTIYRHLPEEIRRRIILTGSLSATDAWVSRTDATGHPILDINGPRLINQVALRNRFWDRMLVPLAPQKPALWCDEAGNGAFRGLFKDPICPLAPRRIRTDPDGDGLQKSA